MKVAAILGVKDEVEIVGASIAHLRQVGVSRIVVCDCGSTDGTLDVVAAECRRGDVTVTHVDPDQVVDYESQSDHDVALVRETGADWVIILDADEFWIPATGSLLTCESLRSADVVVTHRFNVALTDSHLLLPEPLVPANYGRLEMFTRRVPNFRAFMDEYPEEPFITVTPFYKVMARPSLAGLITAGGHDVQASTGEARRVEAPDLVVAHVPFSTRERFERKVANIRTEMARRPALFAGDYAWHWRRWAEMTPDALAAEYDRQISSAGALEEWRRQGVLQNARDLLGLGNDTGPEAGGGWHTFQKPAVHSA